MKNRSLVEKNTATMDGASEWHLIRMKVVKAGPAEDLSGSVAEDVNDGLGRVQDIGIRSQVLMESGSETRYLIARGTGSSLCIVMNVCSIGLAERKQLQGRKARRELLQMRPNCLAMPTE